MPDQPYADAAPAYWRAGWRAIPGGRDSDADRFIAKVAIAKFDACWLWTASPRSPYGKLNVAGAHLGAHVIAWALHAGRWPDPGEVVRHTCDTPKCVNPAHLVIGTHADNSADRVARGRHRYGVETVFVIRSTCDDGHDLTAPDARVTRPAGRLGECRRCANLRRTERRAVARQGATHA